MYDQYNVSWSRSMTIPYLLPPKGLKSKPLESVRFGITISTSHSSHPNSGLTSRFCPGYDGLFTKASPSNLISHLFTHLKQVKSKFVLHLMANQTFSRSLTPYQRKRRDPEIIQIFSHPYSPHSDSAEGSKNTRPTKQMGRYM